MVPVTENRLETKGNEKGLFIYLWDRVKLIERPINKKKMFTFMF